MVAFNTYEVARGLSEYLQSALPELIAAEGLDAIEQWSIGYRDVAGGLQAHPALLIKSDRDHMGPDGPWLQRMETDLALVFRCEEAEEGYRRLCAYQSLLDSLLRDDPHLGGLVAEVVKASFSKARDSSLTLFFLFVDLELDIDVIAYRRD